MLLGCVWHVREVHLLTSLQCRGLTRCHVAIQARKTGHIEEDGASKQELHKLADRFHTVLNRPIDTTTLKGDGITDEIHQAAAKITGRSATTDGATVPARSTMADGPRTPEKVHTNAPHAQPQMILVQQLCLDRHHPSLRRS